MKPGTRTIFILHASDLLTDHRPHGDGLTAFEFIRRLAARGHRLHVAGPEMAIAGPLPQTVRLHPIRTFFRGAVLHRLEYIVRSRLLLRRLRRAEPIDLVHQLNPVNKGISLAALGSGLPLVLGVIVPRWPNDADDEQPSPRRRLADALKEIAKRGLLTIQQRQADALLLATPAARNNLHRPERVAAKLIPLPLGVDLTRFSPRSAAPAAPTILFLANLWRRKGIFTLLEAFDQVAARLPEARLRIAGDGGERAEVERRVAASPFRDRIDLLGPVSREDVPALLEQCTAYCLPSHGEPFANSVLEAMAAGKPIVLTDAGGIREMLPDGGGRKVPPRDPGALAEALVEVLASPDLQAEMGACNRARAEAVFGWDRVIDRLENAYEQVTASPRSLAAPETAHAR